MSQPEDVKLGTEEWVFPVVRDVGAGAPLHWIRSGWADFRACPIPSLFYGFCFAAMGLLVTMVFEHAYAYTVALTSGFLLLGPFLAMGLYEISRRREQGATCALLPTLTVWKRNAGNIGIFAVVLGIVFLVWARASMVVFALFYTNEMPNLTGFLAQLLALDNLEFLLVYFGVGLIFATIVFAVSVISVPLMLDRNQDAISSMLTSVGALMRNPGAMIVWAFMIAGLTVIGFMTFHLGLVVLMPIVGHASWHAYRDLVVLPAAPAG
ncbi:predicted integral membrane protein [Aromatoleum aromaticum EbN1]|uniref:Predicted integral membrane protein n=1 Tax=Aromatoleum aromaticum (strain DSM 19018 / LMG 30748 / EbN1) TaxID=76114 RepID=Q5P1D1_AROAE|nr:DUF2189 domain-containing protein [Aromatoleum aromaticum]CAI08883.1 predicted integral membrane protein [Aromatoleum aromaticum EbN1]